MTAARIVRFIPLALALVAFGARADESTWDVSGNLDLQMRYFNSDTRWQGQDNTAGQVSLTATAEFRWRNRERDQRASIIPYVRWDETDDERSIADLREAYWALETDAFELLVGTNTVFWGVTESVHLVDIINQTDLVGDIDGEDKLGQPMINLEMQRDWGLVSAYVLPWFRERTFAGTDGRLRAGLPVDTNRPVYESSREESHVDLALRYSHYFGDFDIGVSLFSGTSREPRVVPDPVSGTLRPHYDQIDQFGLDLQFTRDAWLWKLEAIARNGFSDSFAAAVGGFEYTIYQVFDSAADIGILLEYQHDGRDDSEPFTTADNDVFVATRLALNDTQDTAVLAGVAYDTETGETFINVEAERRIGENYFLEMRLRAFGGAGVEDLSYGVARDDYFQLTLSRYF